jgi:hypothetical protein
MEAQAQVDKQLLMYETITPLTVEKHKSWSVSDHGDYEFTRDLRFVPILASELALACAEYPIVFIEAKGQAPMPIAVLSLDQSNRFVGERGQWEGSYLPAFIRRYPYIFSKEAEGDTYFLCIDEASSCISAEGISGERIFDESGEQTGYTQRVVSFLSAYQVEHAKTERLGQRLKELNLLEVKQISRNREVEGETKQEVVLNGLQTVDKSRVDTLTDEKLIEIVRDGTYELVCYHWRSLSNLNSTRFG